MDLLDSTITTIAAPTISQGAFGALLIPQGFGLLGSVLPREHIGKAFSAFGPVLGLSAVGGPLLAGLLIDANLFGLGWRPMFLINIVLGAAGLAAGLGLLPRDAGDRAVGIDARGSALLAACMLGLLFGLIQGSTDGWTAGPVAALAAGGLFFAAFAQRQRTASAPLIKPSLLRNRGFTAGLILGLVFFAAVAGLLYAVSLFLQRGAGYSPERAAVTGFAPIAAGIVIASVACRNLVTRLGRRLSLAGIAVTVAGVAVLAAVVAHSGTTAGTAELAPAMTLIGLGMGATFSAIYDTAIGDIDPAEAGSASGSLSAVQQLAAAIETASNAALVRSAFELPAEQRTEIEQAISEIRGAAVRVSYESVPGLISGLELSAGGRKLAWSVADYLAALEKSVGEILESPQLPAVNK